MTYGRWERSLRVFKSLLRNLFSNRTFTIGFILFMAIALTGLIGRRVMPFDPLRTGSFRPNQQPSLGHILGTDSLGRDLFAQLLMSIEYSLIIGLIVATVGTFTGAAVGFIAGYYGGPLDAILRTATDVVIIIPSLPILIVMASFLKVVSIWTMAAILSIFSWAWPARQVRAQTLSLKERDFIHMARLSGMGGTRIVFTEIMPHMIQWMSANFTNATLVAMLAETGLAIIGLGPMGTMTLGMMIYWANSYAAMFRGLWWWWSPPIVTLIGLFTSLFLLHTGLDEIVNPRLRKGSV